MPIHALVGHLVLIVAPVTAGLALVYAWAPRTRAALRIPLVVAGAVSVALAYWAGTIGTDLLNTLKARAAARGQQLPDEVHEHTLQANTLELATVTLLVIVLVVVWWILAPGRPSGAGTLVGAVLLTLGAVAVGWYCATTLIDALHAVWAQHTLWPG